MQVRVEIECEKPVNSARVIVALASPTLGVLSAVSTPYQNVEIDLKKGRNVVTLNLYSVPLLVGSYHFNISLCGPKTEDFYHRLLAQSPIRVTGPPINTDGRGIRGVFKVEHDWKVG